MITPKELLKFAFEIDTKSGIITKDLFVHDDEFKSKKSWQIAKDIFSIVYKKFHISYNEEKICIYSLDCNYILCRKNEWKKNYDTSEHRLQFDSWDDAISYINENKVELRNNLKEMR